MSVEVQMEDADSVKQTKLIEAIEQLDRKLARKLILDEGVEPVSKIHPGNLLRFLRVAVESRDPLLVSELLKQKANVNCPEGGQILWIVVEDGDTEIASMLVRAGANLNERMRGCNFIHVLISSANKKKHELALLMLEYGADVNVRDVKGHTAIYYAVKSQLTDLVEELLRRGAVFGDYLINYAASKPKAAELVPMLIKRHGADETTRDRQAISAIMYLITRDNDSVAVIEALLDIGVPVDQLNSCGWTSLAFATIFERLDVVKLLLKYGADVNKKSENGVLPLFVASSLKRSALAKLLIEKGASIHDHNENDRQYPIHAACANESLQNIHLLLQLGANINVVDRSDRTPFSLMDTAETLNNSIKHVIKHLALVHSKGSTIHDLDLAIIYENSHTQCFYEECLGELQKMKIVKIYNDTSFFSIFASSIRELSTLMKNTDFIKSYNKSSRKSLFPLYFVEMSIAFRNAEKRKNIISFKENTLMKMLHGALPYIAIKKIAYYSYLNDLRCE